MNNPLTWKFWLSMVVFSLGVANQAVDPVAVDEMWGIGKLEDGHGVRAAIYTLLGALFLFIAMIDSAVLSGRRDAESNVAGASDDAEHTDHRTKLVNRMPLAGGAAATFLNQSQGGMYI